MKDNVTLAGLLGVIDDDTHVVIFKSTDTIYSGECGELLKNLVDNNIRRDILKCNVENIYYSKIYNGLSIVLEV